ncbi:putative ribonuclease H-like domain-containing protein [Tanacetum coccineum]
MTHPSPKRNMVPKAVLMRSGLVSLTTARPVNTTQPKTTANSARPMTNIFNKARSTVRRPINNKTATKNSNFNKRVNIVSGKNVNTVRPKAVVNVARPKAVLNAVKGNQGNPQQDLEDKGVIDSGCSRHMTGNMSYLTDFEEIDGGYVAFGSNPKGGKITGRALGFMRPFGCPVTILNSIDHLGKFDGKVDEGFFVGYSINSLAFRVFNSRTRIVEENLHVQFSENTANIAGRNQSNGNASTKACDHADLKSSPNAGFKPSSDGEKKVNGDPSKEDERDDQEKDDNVNDTNNINTASDGNSTNNVNAVSLTANATGIEVNAVGRKSSIELPDDPNMPELEDIVYSDNDEDVGAEADMNNLDAFMPVSPIPTTRIHKDHPVEQIIGDLNSAPQTRRMIKNLKEHEEPKKVYRNKKDKRGIVIKNKARLVGQGYTQEEGIDYDEVFSLVSRIEAIRLFLAYALFKDFVVYQMDVKSSFFCGKIEEKVYICQPPGFEDPDFPDRVYKVEKALYGLHQAPRAWYETLPTFLLDNGFQREKIDKTLFIRMDKGDILLVQVYVDDIIFGSTKKSLCTEFEKMMHKKFQMSSMGEITFFLGLQTASIPMETQKPLLKDEDVCACARYQVNQKVSHLHAVKRFFRYLKGQLKLGLWYPKDSPFDLVAYIDSDYARASLDRKSTTGGCQFLRCKLISWQCKKQTVVTNSTTKAEYVAASSCCGQVLIMENVAFLSKPTESEGFEQIVDFRNASSIRYALTVNPTIYTSCIEQFWATVKMKTFNGVVQLQALVDGKKIIITEATVRRDLQLEDAEGIDCLSNATIFEHLSLMGYEKLSQKLTFYKAFFSPQWKFLIHTVLQCLSAKSTAWNEFSSTMASAIICLATNQKFNFSKYIFESMVKNLKNVSGKFLMYPRFVQSKQLFPTMVVQAQEEMGEGSEMPTDPHHTPIITQPSSSQPQRKQKSRRPKKKDTKIPQSSVPSDPINVSDEAVNEEPSMQLKELMDFYTKLQQRVLDLENTKTAQAQEITSLKLRVKRLEKQGRSRTHKLKRLYKIGRSARVVSFYEASLGDQEDASKQERKIDDIDKDAEITLVDETQERHDNDLMFDTGVLNDEEVFAGQDMAEKEVSTADPVTTAGEVVTTANVAVSTVSIIPVSSAATITKDEITLGQALAELKSVKPKVTTATTTATKGIVLQEPSESRTTTTTIPSKDKGKGIMVEEPSNMKKKDQISFDEQEAIRLQAEFDKEVRLAREKDEANVALIKEWNDIQTKIETDYELAQDCKQRSKKS